MGRRLARMLSPSLALRDVVDGARNVALFAGWGVVWMVTARPGRTWRELRNAVLTASALSLGVESAQLLSDDRIASVLDLATNVGGSAAGALGLVAIVLGLSKRSESRSFVGIPASIFAIAYGAAVVAEALVPLFRQERVVRVAGGPLERLATVLGAFRWDTLLEPPWADFLLFLPAGAFAVAALYESGWSYRAGTLVTAVTAAFVMPLAELGHGVLGFSIDAGAMALHTVAVTAGGALAWWGLPALTRRLRGSARPRVLTYAYVALLSLWALRPYRPEESLRTALDKLGTNWWIPLHSLGMRVDMFSVVDVVAPFLLYAALGALLSVWPLRSRGWLRGFAPALYVSVAMELAQIFVAGRTLDITDLMIQCAGATVGWLVVRRAGYRPYGTQLGPRHEGRVRGTRAGR